MTNRFSSGKFSIAQCDRCNFRFKLKELKTETIKTKQYKILVCPACWDPDHPQLQLGMYPVNDPQAVREPRPDVSYYASGSTGLYTSPTSSNAINNAGYPSDGSRQTDWGWAPVGGSSSFDSILTPNALVAISAVGTVSFTNS